MEHRTTRILHVVGALAVAIAGSVFLLTRVNAGFEPLRFKIHKGPALVAADARVALEFDRRLSADVWAVITSVTSSAHGDRRVTVSINDEVVCERTVPHGTHRLDCVWTPDAGSLPTRQAILVAGETSDWALETFEIATHHGSTRGHDLVVFPEASGRFIAPGLISAALVFGLLVIAGLLPFTPLPDWVRTAYVGSVSLIAAGATAVMIAPWVTPYRLLISVDWFVLAALILTWPRIIPPVLRHVSERSHGWQVAWRVAVALTCVAMTYGALVGHVLVDHFDRNPSGFLRLAAATVERHPLIAADPGISNTLIVTNDTGYDGQFAYFMAFDPLLTTFEATPEVHQQFIDAPSYRYGRIGYSWLTTMLSGGDAARFPIVMMMLVMLGIAATMAGVGWYARTVGSDLALAGLVVLIPGFWQSVQVALPEPLAAAFLVAGCVLFVRERWLAAAGCFAASLLMRETGAIVVAACLIAVARSGHWRRAGVMACMALVPVVVWRLYVGWQLAPVMGAEAFWHSTGDFGVPLAGIVDLWVQVANGTYYSGNPAFTVSGVWYPLLLIAGVVLAMLLVRRRADVFSVSTLMYGVLSISLTFNKIWEHVGNGQRGTYELFLLLGLSAIGQWSELSAQMRSAVLVFAAATAGYVFWGAFDATLVRESIGWMVSRMIGAG